MSEKKQNRKSDTENNGGKKEEKQAGKPAPRINQKYFYIVLVLIPVLFFVLLELGLRLFNYGVDNRQWAEMGSYRILNPNVAHRYFYNTGSYPYSIQDIFLVNKPAKAFRVFVLGESSAAGYPYMPNGSFSRYLQQRLESMYPDYTIEVVNLGITAINTYTIRDLMPGILDQKTDLVVIYTGHNEYYGALGVGSVETLGNSRFFVNMALYLNRFKTFELLRDVIRSVKGSVAPSEGEKTEGTLMSRIAKNQYIAYNSDVYKAGLKQFEGNMRDILQMAKDKNVPVILGTLASNLKDQKPFVSARNGNYPAASEIFTKAQAEYGKGNYEKAKFLFKQARDLDELRFRAPEDVNTIIYKLASEYNCKLADFEKEFEQKSPNGIIGDNLMTDHLHPTIGGYFLMGNLVYNKIAELNLLPKSTPVVSSLAVQDSLTRENFIMTPVDTVIAKFRIAFLKNDWPYIEKKDALPISELIKPKDFVDSAAYEVIEGGTWDKAHRYVAFEKLKHNDLDGFVKEMKTLIIQYPIVSEFYKTLIDELLNRQLYDEAIALLNLEYKKTPNDYCTKWLGIINLARNNVDAAQMYLTKSLEFNQSDAQVYYNLAGVYVTKKNNLRAYELVNRSLEIMPNYAEAIDLQRQLRKALKL
jgi:tetratricopeptide (TPR) repeat protein